jgi:ADP-heptose:LPS heptosyltransferase
MSDFTFPSSTALGPVNHLKPSLGRGEVFRDPALQRVYLELNSNGLGDVINLVPLVQEISAARPDVAIVVVSNQWRLPFHWTAPNVSTVASPIDVSRQREKGSRYFDLSAHVRYHLYTPHWLQFFFITGIGTYTPQPDPFPLIDESQLDEFKTRVAGIVGTARGYILLHLENTRRDWEGRNTDPENLLVIARRLAAEGYCIIEIGNDNPPSGEFTHIGKLSLDEFTVLTKRATAFVGIDSFPMHVAALYDKPILGFFAATQPEVVLPPVTRLVAMRNESLACNGCVYVVRPRDANRCVLGHLECAHALPAAYLDDRFEKFLKTIDCRGRERPTRHAREHLWRMAQLLFEEDTILDQTRGKRLVPGDVRARIAAAISSELIE